MLLENKKTFNINLVGSTTKSSYIGSFTVKCVLTPLEHIAANKLYRSLIGTDNATYTDEHTLQLAFCLAQLKYRIEESPAFWKNQDDIDGGHVLDDNVIMHLLNEATQAELEYREEMSKQAEEAVKQLQKAVEEDKIPQDDEKPEEQELIPGGIHE